jgi:hypothetical protein
MAGPKVSTAEPKDHVFDLSLGEGRVVMYPPKVYRDKPKVDVFDLCLC